jgi:hypothetical protein
MLDGHGPIFAHKVCAVAAGEPGWLVEGCPGGHPFSHEGPYV